MTNIIGIDTSAIAAEILSVHQARKRREPATESTE